jgi:triosephosphate isomerase
MKKCIVFTNWKMNKTLDESRTFFHELVNRFGRNTNLELIMCIPAPFIGFVTTACAGSCIGVGSENHYTGDYGAFTGEISAPMLASVGCEYALIGHSERRTYFHEDDDLVNSKLISALTHGLFPIVCIGETRAEREAGQAFSILKRQVQTCLKNVGENHKLHVAYEPRWAIGTGTIPDYGEIEDAHLFIREQIESIFGPSVSGNTAILYGGSVSPDNTFSICSLRGVDGVGFGGCSLDLECLSRGIDESLRAFDLMSRNGHTP